MIIRPQCVQDGGFVLSPDSCRYARVLLVRHHLRQTPVPRPCALVSTIETDNTPDNVIIVIILDWVKTIGSDHL